METLLIGSPWFAAALGVASYAAGYAVLLWEAYLYYTGAQNHIVFEGLYEWSPALEKTVTGRRFLSIRFLATLAVLALASVVLQQLFLHQYQRPEAFSFLMGGLVLVEIAAAMQRLPRIMLFRSARTDGAVYGKIEYSKRVVHTLFFVGLYSFAVLYLLIFLLTTSWFFLGGALMCFVAGHRRRDWTIVYT